MNNIFVGGDASKGYADFHIMDESETVLHRMKLDDTSAGHKKLYDLLKEYYSNARVVVGFESSGGVERNWIHGLRNFSDIDNLLVYEVSPLLVKKSRESLRLHESITDPTSARAIAEYLKINKSKDFHQQDLSLQEARRLEHFVAGLVEHQTSLKTQLQGVLVNSHPELVRFTRNGIPAWVLQLLLKYPTSHQLAAAAIEDLVRIPYLTREKASGILAAARSSVGSAYGTYTVVLVTGLAKTIINISTEIETYRSALIEPFKENPVVVLYNSLPGFGLLTAVYLYLLLGDCRHFHSAAAVVAFCGLDCRKHQSGDKDYELRISRRGDSRVRALLFTSALTAIRTERFKKFYLRLIIENGKPKMVALVALMGKLLRIAYAVQITQKPFDPDLALPEHYPVRKQLVQKESASLAAPVSRREANRRKKATKSPNEVKPHNGVLAAVANLNIT